VKRFRLYSLPEQPAIFLSRFRVESCTCLKSFAASLRITLERHSSGPNKHVFAQLSVFPLPFLFLSTPLANLALKNTLAQVQQPAPPEAALPPTPAGLESGLISNFDDGTTAIKFGAWTVSTDQLAGGTLFTAGIEQGLFQFAIDEVRLD